MREMAEKFATEEIDPIADGLDKKNEFPHEMWKKFGDMGLLGKFISFNCA
jgi:isovaleryl-CoA dehydrogenase